MNEWKTKALELINENHSLREEIERLRKEKEYTANTVMVNVAKIAGILAASGVDVSPIDKLLEEFTKVLTDDEVNVK